MAMKTKWTKEAPKKDGWYWITYEGERGRDMFVSAKMVVPAIKITVHNGWLVRTVNSTMFHNYAQKDLKFGPKIKEPEN